MSAMGTEVPPGKAIGLAVSPGKVVDVWYVASKPEPCTDASDEKTTYSRPFDEDTVKSDLVPVMVSASGADDKAPL